MGDTVCLTSYQDPRGGIHLFNSTKIWQACQATSAATSFFDHIDIGPYGEEFVDGALGRTTLSMHYGARPKTCGAIGYRPGLGALCPSAPEYRA
jgi:hypothetical protein